MILLCIKYVQHGLTLKYSRVCFKIISYKYLARQLFIDKLLDLTQTATWAINSSFSKSFLNDNVHLYYCLIFFSDMIGLLGFVYTLQW